MADRPAADSIEVVYATTDIQHIVRVAFQPGLTAEGAVRLSGLPETFPAIDEHSLTLGVFGALVPLDYQLAPGDRVEICRPLLRDPRERRRELAIKKPGRG